MSAKSRFTNSMLTGVLASAALTMYEATKRHAVFAAAAAKQPAGQHVTASVILAAGFAGTTLAVALVVFILLTLRAGRRARKARQVTAGRQPAPARRYGGGGGGGAPEREGTQLES